MIVESSATSDDVSISAMRMGPRSDRKPTALTAVSEVVDVLTGMDLLPLGAEVPGARDDVATLRLSSC